MRRPELAVKMGNYYAGGPIEARYYVNGVRIPLWLWRILCRWLQP